jgi:hypothetical protein
MRTRSRSPADRCSSANLCRSRRTALTHSDPPPSPGGLARGAVPDKRRGRIWSGMTVEGHVGERREGRRTTTPSFARPKTDGVSILASIVQERIPTGYAYCQLLPEQRYDQGTAGTGARRETDTPPHSSGARGRKFESCRARLRSCAMPNVEGFAEARRHAPRPPEPHSEPPAELSPPTCGDAAEGLLLRTSGPRGT